MMANLELMISNQEVIHLPRKISTLSEYREGYMDGRLQQHMANEGQDYFLGHRRGFYSKLQEGVLSMPFTLKRFLQQSSSLEYSSFLQGFFLEEKAIPDKVQKSLTYFSSSEDFIRQLTRYSFIDKEEQAYIFGLSTFFKSNKLNHLNSLVLRHPQAQHTFHTARLGICAIKKRNKEKTTENSISKTIFNPPYVYYLCFRAYTYAKMIIDHKK